jgi:type II secretory pathway pseudopilin PulG
MDNNNPNTDIPDQPQPVGPRPPAQQPAQPDAQQPQPAPQQPQVFGPAPQPQQQPQSPQPVQGQQPYQQPQQQAGQTDTLGIISIIMAFFIPFIGFILGLVGRSKAKKGGYSGTLSMVGIIVNAVFMVIGTLILVSLVLTSFQGAQQNSRDTEATYNANMVYQKLEESYNNNRYYPEELGLEDLSGIDPAVLDAVNSGSEYRYTPTGCRQSKYQSYTISVELERGDTFGNKTYQKTSLN